MNYIIDKKSSLYILIVVILGAFLIPYTGSSLNVSLPSIGKDFALDLVVLNWIPTVFILANAAFILPFGRLGDIFGRKKIFTIGVSIFTLSSFLAAAAPSAFFLIVFSFMQGLGCSMIFATGVAILSSVFPLGSRGEFFGIYVTSVFMGLFSGPILGGFLTQNFGWRSIFLFNIPLGLIIIFLIYARIKTDWIGSQGENFDIKGTVIYIPSVIFILYGFTTVFTVLGKILIISGVLGLLIFLKLESSEEYPIIHPQIFKKTVPLLSSSASLLLNTSTSAVWVLISLYLQLIQSISPIAAGVILAIQPLLVAIISPFAGRLSDRIGGAPLSSIGIILTVLGLYMATFLEVDTPIVLIMMLGVILGVSNALFASPNTNTFMGSVDRRYFGSASATYSTLIFSGQLLSMAIVLLVFSSLLGGLVIDSSEYAQFMLSLKITFSIFTFVCILGTILIFLILIKSKN
ncbi:MAG: MFS transporter [Euryarchaeota archaeon]|nr:MFS transporter [Euryarchaeota archaeon]MBU4608216.1 MFS transporter [Euryarchaeota archaeon]MBV1730085.1 MFS transporter [Methanobacterium sp.]MBV1754606.1 MFS transporter [Methanobacterium sp.]